MANSNITISEISMVMMNSRMQNGMFPTQTGSADSFQSLFGQSQNLNSNSQSESPKVANNAKLQDVVNKNSSNGSNRTKDILKSVNNQKEHADDATYVDVQTEIKNIVTARLEITDEELESAMAELGLTYVDLLLPQNVSNLIAQIKDIEPAMIITDADLTANLTNIVNEITQLINETAQTLQMPVETFVEDFKDYVMNENSDNKVEMNTVKTVVDESTGKQITITLEDNRVEDTKVEVVKNDSLSGTEQFTGENVSQEDGSQKESSKDAEGQSIVTGLMNNLTESLNNSIDGAATFSDVYNVNTADVVNQLIESIRLNVNVDTTTMELQLTPENLGKLNLSVASKDGIITATITTQNEAVKAIIESQLVQLKETFNNQGLKVTDVEVTVAGQAFDRNAENNNGNASSQKHSQRRFRGVEELLTDNMGVTDDSGNDSIIEQLMEANGNSLNLKA